MPVRCYQLVYGLFLCILLAGHHCGSVVGEGLPPIAEVAKEQSDAGGGVNHQPLRQEVDDKEKEEDNNANRNKEPVITNAHQRDDPLCDPPVPPENGYIKGNNYSYEAVVHIYCEQGYTLTGPTKLTCLPVPFHGARGIWVPQDEYKCLEREEPETEIEERDSFEDIRCPAPSVPEHGSVEGTDFSMGAQIHYVCDDGYSISGPQTANCFPVPDPFHHVAIWDPPSVPVCRVNPPPIPPLTEFSAWTNGVPQTLAGRTIQSISVPKPIEGLPEVCSLPKVVGPCKAAIPRFYFDVNMLECLPFTYGGCRGNENNFETLQKCQKTCR